MRFSFTTKHVLAVTCGLGIILSSLAVPAQANRQQVRQGLPGRRISGGIRSECLKDSNQSLVALSPRNLMGKTAQERPTFWFSLPTTEGTKSIRFALANSADDVVYSTQIDRSQASGLSKIELPPTAPALQVGENYYWVLSIRCEESPSAALEVKGWVRRVEISQALSNQIAAADLAEQAYLYEVAGLWHEQVTTLAELRSRNPNSLEAQLSWAALIQSSGLDSHVSSSPFETVVGNMNERATSTTF